MGNSISLQTNILKQCLLDFGPSHSFWCFAFERCNGLLGSYPTNKKAIEIQVMRKFCDSQSVRTLTPQVDVDFKIVLPVSYNATDSASPFVFNDDISIHSLLSMSHSPLHSIKSFENSGVVTLLPPFREDVLGFEEVSNLAVIYQQLYPEKQIEKDDLSRFYLRSKKIKLAGDLIGSSYRGSTNTSSGSSVIMAYWPRQGNDLSVVDYASRMSVGVIQYYIQHTVSFSTNVPATQNVINGTTVTS